MPRLRYVSDHLADVHDLAGNLLAPALVGPARTRESVMPLDRSHVDALNNEVAAVAQAQAALDAAKAAKDARLESFAPHLNEGDFYSLTGAPVPVVTKQQGRVVYLLIPAAS